MVDDGLFDLLEDGGEVALHIGQFNAQGAGIAHERSGKVRFDEEAAALGDSLQQGFGMGVIRAEEGGLVAIFLKPGRDLFEDKLLRPGDTDIACRVGSRLEVEFYSQVLAGLFHDVAATGEQFVAHVAREGTVDEVRRA